MSTAPTAAVAEETPTTEQRQRATEDALAAQLGPPPGTEPPADTQAAQAAQAAAQKAVAALEASARELERAYTVAAQTADVAAMTALAAQRPLRQTELLTLAVSAAQAVEHACVLQGRDAHGASGPVREFARRADEIADEKREIADLAEQQARRATGLAQHAGLRVVNLSERCGQAQQAVRAATARLSEHLAAPSAPPLPAERSRLL